MKPVRTACRACGFVVVFGRAFEPVIVEIPSDGKTVHREIAGGRVWGRRGLIHECYRGEVYFHRGQRVRVWGKP